MSYPDAKSGVTVNWKTALEVSTVMACARVIAEGVAQVPLKIMKRRENGGADEARDHPLFDLLSRKPNAWQTSFEFRETLALHLVLCGNAYVFVNRGLNGKVLELIPLEPGWVSIERKADMSLVYSVNSPDGAARNVPSEAIWHLRGPSWNSWMGLEAVKLAREAIGLAISLEQSHAYMHKNGVQPAGTYSVEGTLNAEQYKQLSDWIKSMSGGANRGAPMVLDRGAKWLQQQMSGVDAQHIETRKLQIEEICRAMRVMPIMVGYSDKAATYASAEQMFLAHAVHTLTPWCERIEMSADVNLLDDPEYYVLLDLRSLMRGALKDQAEYYAKALGSGGSPAWMSQDEVRDECDLNPMGGAAANLREPSNVGNPAPAEADAA
jgi:HK97 family phage portal protein